jgi:hypothetical protein
MNSKCCVQLRYNPPDEALIEQKLLNLFLLCFFKRNQLFIIIEKFNSQDSADHGLNKSTFKKDFQCIGFVQLAQNFQKLNYNSS